MKYAILLTLNSLTIAICAASLAINNTSPLNVFFCVFLIVMNVILIALNVVRLLTENK